MDISRRGERELVKCSYYNKYRVVHSNLPVRFLKKSQPIMRLQRRVIRRWNGNFVSFYDDNELILDFGGHNGLK